MGPLLERITTLKTRGAVQAVVGSPDGRWLVVVRGESRLWVTSTRMTGAEAYRRTEAGLERVGEIPPAATMYVLDDGTVVGVHCDYNEVEVVRHAADGAVEATFCALRGMSLDDFQLALEADGRHITVEALDRDDGHGYTLTYTQVGSRIDVRSGKVGSPGPSAHLLRGPGVPTRSPHVGGDAAALQARIAALPFRAEWPLSVGPSRLLTTARVIDVASGEAVFGGSPLRRPFDLSADERLVLGADSGVFAVHDLQRAVAIEQLDPKYKVLCAAFLTAREIVVGTADGRVLLLGLPG